MTTRQTISFTEPNNDWLLAQLENKEYHSKSEVINSLIRQERERQEEKQAIRSALIQGEQSPLSNKTPHELLESFQEKARNSGLL